MTAQQLQWDDRLSKRGAVLHEAQTQRGQWYWRLVLGSWLDLQEARGLANINVDTQDANGQRLTGIDVRQSWPSGYALQRTEAKPGEPYAVGIPMHSAGRPYSIRIESNYPSDSVSGLGMGTIEEPGVKFHTSYFFVFRLMQDPSPPAPPDPQPPDPDSLKRVRLLLDEIGMNVRLAHDLLEKLV